MDRQIINPFKGNINKKKVVVDEQGWIDDASSH